MNIIAAAIFDMDGLMIDSEPLQSKAYEKVLLEHGVEVKTGRKLIQVPGIGPAENWRILKERHNLSETTEVLKNKKYIAYENLLNNGVNLMPGLLNLLELLSKHGAKLAVASSSPRKHIAMVMEQKDLAKYFDTIVSFDDVINTKPDPEIFLTAADRLCAKNTNCIVFEDALSGIRAAKAAGMRCVAVPSAADLNSPDFQAADLVLSSLEKVTWEVLIELVA